MNGHYCNGGVDPNTCCPLGHYETDERFCTCKVSPEMAKAVRAFNHELYLETYRQYDQVLREWVLRNHRTHLVEFGPIGPHMRADCRLKSGSAKIKDGNICNICNKVIDWVPEVKVKKGFTGFDF